MLIEYSGIIDSGGLRTFRRISNPAMRSDAPEHRRFSSVGFWAVLDAETAEQILRVLQSGSRIRAMRLLEESAISIGSQSLG